MSKAKRAQPDLPIKPGNMKMDGFDGKPLKATTPEAIQEAADTYFDRKDAAEQAKDRLETAIMGLEAEMATHKMTVAVVRDMTGNPYVVRVKPGKTKLEVKAAQKA